MRSKEQRLRSLGWERKCDNRFMLIASSTRSQAVARIADRTAKNCRGHLT